MSHPLPPARHMGLGTLANPNIVFHRDFRWVLESPNLPAMLTKKLSVDYTSRTMAAEFYELFSLGDSDLPIQKWLDTHVNSDVLTLSYLDGLGNTLCQWEFSDLQVSSNETSELDYSCSDASVRKVRLQYKRVRRLPYYDRYGSAADPNQYGLEIPGHAESFQVRLPAAPTTAIQEAEPTNSISSAPAEGRREITEIFVPCDVAGRVVLALADNEGGEVRLNHPAQGTTILYDYGIKRLRRVEKEYQITLRYNYARLLRNN